MRARHFKLQTARLPVIVVLLLGLPSVGLALNCECSSSSAQLIDSQCYTLSPTVRPRSAETCWPNGRIAVLDSQHKRDTLWEPFLRLQQRFAWIGLVDAVPGGHIIRNWTWENGQELTWSDWKPGHPDGYSTALASAEVEDCVVIDRNGQWQDKPCDFMYRTLCETSKPAIQGSHWFQLLTTNKWLGLDRERLLVSSLEECSLLCFNIAECYMFAVGTGVDSVGLTCQLGCYYDVTENAPGDDWRLFNRDIQ